MADKHSPYIPIVRNRGRVPTSAIRKVVKTIAKKFNPDQVILFGSYAYGKPRPGSDVDLLVVMDTSQGIWPLTTAIRSSLPRHSFGLDILVRSQEEIERRIALDDWFLEEIITKGKVLYSIALEKLSRPRRFFTAEFAEIAEKP